MPVSPPRPELLSLNTTTVRAQWSLPQIIAGCARHRIESICPWRDQVAAAGLKESAQQIRDAGLRLSGYCRGGMFPADEHGTDMDRKQLNDLDSDDRFPADGGRSSLDG